MAEQGSSSDQLKKQTKLSAAVLMVKELFHERFEHILERRLGRPASYSITFTGKQERGRLIMEIYVEGTHARLVSLTLYRILKTMMFSGIRRTKDGKRYKVSAAIPGWF